MTSSLNRSPNAKTIAEFKSKYLLHINRPKNSLFIVFKSKNWKFRNSPKGITWATGQWHTSSKINSKKMQASNLKNRNCCSTSKKKLLVKKTPVFNRHKKSLNYKVINIYLPMSFHTLSGTFTHDQASCFLFYIFNLSNNYFLSYYPIYILIYTIIFSHRLFIKMVQMKLRIYSILGSNKSEI